MPSGGETLLDQLGVTTVTSACSTPVLLRDYSRRCKGAALSILIRDRALEAAAIGVTSLTKSAGE